MTGVQTCALPIYHLPELGVDPSLALRRNRVRRRLREIIRLHMAAMGPGWDVVMIARPPASQADFITLETACLALLRRASLLS